MYMYISTYTYMLHMTMNAYTYIHIYIYIHISSCIHVISHSRTSFELSKVDVVWSEIIPTCRVWRFWVSLLGRTWCTVYFLANI